MLRKGEAENYYKKEVLSRLTHEFPSTDLTKEGFAEKLAFYDKHTNIEYGEAKVEIIKTTKLGFQDLVKISNIFDFDGKKLPDIEWEIDENNFIYYSPTLKPFDLTKVN